MSDVDTGLMTIFNEALEQTDPAERAAYLDTACGDDAALRQRVEAMLVAREGAGRFLEPDATGVFEPRSPASPETVPDDGATGDFGPQGECSTIAGARPAARPAGFVAGQVIAGRYTLLEVLGEGGMGTVYRADQTAPVKRQVALKLIKVGMDSRVVLGRFDAERQALALMDHPNIARVYDGGTTEVGQPFFVMELVLGEPITDYCDRKRLPVRARLELFVTACHAVQHAHQKGIIHRDLKPSNVMVTEVDGRPTAKVIDFGVAKATEFNLTDQSVGDTGAIVGTPTYMSPEQADPSSMDIDTRTDIYALGVILYELLAGSPPLDAAQFKRGAILEMLRMVREVEPPRPSTKVSTAEALPNIAARRAVDPEQLKRALRGDLDWIVMMALEKDRTRRYDSANGFAADVLRHLAYEPVLAAPPSRVYLLRKFVRKNRVGVLAASLVLLALLGGIAGTSWGLYRANRATAAEAKRVRERDDALIEVARRVKQRDAALDEADKALGSAKHQLDNSNFLLAVTAYDNRDVSQARLRLHGIDPIHRGWEWNYFRRQSSGGIFTLYGHTDSVTSVAVSADGTRIVTGSKDRTAKVWDARTGTRELDLRGHKGDVHCVALSPDGSRIVTGGDDGTAKVWDARTGTQVLEFKPRTKYVFGVAFSPNGTQIITGGGDFNIPGEARVWDAQTGASQLDLKGHAGAVHTVAFSADGSRVATGSGDRTAKVWDAQTGTLQFELQGHSNSVTSVAFSPDAKRIVTGSTPTMNNSASISYLAKVWDGQTGAHKFDLKGHTGFVSSAAFSPDGAQIATGSWDKTVQVWDARTGTSLRELKGHTRYLSSVAFSPDGSRIVTGSGDKTAKVWDARFGLPQLELKGQRGSVTSVAFSPDGNRMVTGSADNVLQSFGVKRNVDGTMIRSGTGKGEKTVTVWDARTGVSLLDLMGHTGIVSSVAFSPDGTRIVSGSYDKTAKVWDSRTGESLLELKGHTGKLWSVAFSPDGTRILTGSSDRTAKLWDSKTGTPQIELKGHADVVTSVAFSPDGKRIATGSGDNSARVWDAHTGTVQLELKGHSEAVHSVAFSQDPVGSRIATGSWDRSAKVWDAQTGRLQLELKGHGSGVVSVTFSPDGTRIATGSGDKTAKVWDAQIGTPQLELKGHTDIVTSVVFSPDGGRIATGSGDHTAKLWDARIGMPPMELNGHTDVVASTAFSGDGSRLVTGSGDRTAKVSDTNTGTALLELKGHTDQVHSVAFSADDTRIATGSGDKTARVWDAKTGSLQLELKHKDVVTSVAFSIDGSRLVTVSEDRTLKAWDARAGFFGLDIQTLVNSGRNWGMQFGPEGMEITFVDAESVTLWDVRTGQALKGEPVPKTVPNEGISPGGRWFAYADGNRVELIPLQLDADELAYRRLQTGPNFARYREAFMAARVAKDDFAAGFYSKLLRANERTAIVAEADRKDYKKARGAKDEAAAAVYLNNLPESERAAVAAEADADEYVEMYNSVTDLLKAAKRDQAVALLEEMLTIKTAKLGPTHSQTIEILNRLGLTYNEMGQFDKAILRSEEQVKALEAKIGRDDLQTLRAVANLAVAYMGANRIKDAIPSLEEAHRASKKHREIAWVINPLISAYRKGGENDKVVTLLSGELAESRIALPKESPQLASLLAQIGMTFLDLKKWSEAEPLIRECLTIREKVQPDHWLTFNTKSMLGGSLLGQQKYAEAEPLLLAAYEGMSAREKTIPPQGGTRIPETLARLIELYTTTDKPDQLKKWQAERAKYPEFARPPQEKK
jgi:eukaryotic-like serine/threonine-protein kinase